MVPGNRMDSAGAIPLDFVVTPHWLMGDGGGSVIFTSSPASRPVPPPKCPRAHAISQEKHCSAAVCMPGGKKLHQARDVVNSPGPGCKVPYQLCDNGTNLLSALYLRKLTHVPCLVNVLNIIMSCFPVKIL